MLNSKDRKKLEALAVGYDAIVQVGKARISDSLIESLADALWQKELVKVAILANSELDPHEAAEVLAEKTASEVVAVRGNKIVIYKYSKKEGIKHVLC